VLSARIPVLKVKAIENRSIDRYIHEQNTKGTPLLVQVLSARIPVLKVKSTTGVPVDITISDSAQHTGLLARDLVLGYLNEAPQLTPLVIVLKSFLREMGLNDPYMGGMSSYSLVVLLWLFVCESAHRGYNVTDLGYQLIGFFSMFLYRFESQVRA